MRSIVNSILIAAALGFQTAAVKAEPPSLESEIRRLAADYARDPKRVDATFGIRVDGEAWTILSTDSEVMVKPGAPETPAFFFATDCETFSRIASGEMQMSTAMVQARSSDWTPVILDYVHDFQFDSEARKNFWSLAFHFFTTGQPEALPLAADHARFVHGGAALPIYYAPQLRSSWYGVMPGQHINEDPADQVNDFDSIFIIIKAGSAQAKFGRADYKLKDNEAIYVPAGMSHELWNDGEEEAAFILLMFGENA